MNDLAANLRKKLINLFTKFDGVRLKLVKFEDFLKTEKMKGHTIGVNEFYPSIDCAHIIKSYPSKRSGFYWIKNNCTPRPLRVYCDFDSYQFKAGLDYYIFNGNQIPNSFLKNIKDFKDIGYTCSSLGLEPIRIKSIKNIQTISKVLTSMGYSLNLNAIIPLGYDYNCDFAKCSGLYKSLNDENSSDINDLLNSFNSADNQIFTKNIVFKVNLV